MSTLKSLIMLTFSLFATAVFADDISQQALLKALNTPKNNIVILDVRSVEEYNNGHLANAINISHNTVADKLNQLEQYKDNTVVVYCRSGRRAGFAENILTENGFTKVRHLDGDMNGWLEANLPVVINNIHSNNKKL